MSKSLGNIMRVRDIRQKYSGEVVRYFILSANYRSPLNFSEEQLQQAKSSLQRLNNVVYNLKYLLKQKKFKKSKDENDKIILEKRKENEQKFIKAMDDDFNTPVALSYLFDFTKGVNIYLDCPGLKNQIVLEDILKFYQDLAGGILGIINDINTEENIEEEIKKLIKEREKARKIKDWNKSDQIRDKLKKKGIILEDTPEAVRWKKLNSVEPGLKRIQ
jgi:cysteinyl-tRNA synthetase